MDGSKLESRLLMSDVTPLPRSTSNPVGLRDIGICVDQVHCAPEDAFPYGTRASRSLKYVEIPYSVSYNGHAVISKRIPGLIKYPFRMHYFGEYKGDASAHATTNGDGRPKASKMRLALLLVLCAICALVTWATPLQPGDGIHLTVTQSQDAGASPAFTVFKSENNPDTQIRFIKDSGVCETTPGVGQLSGYIDIGTNMSTVRLLSDLKEVCFNTVL